MALAKNAPKSQFMLSTEAFNEISDVLKELEASTRAELAVFCDANGVPITHAGKPRAIDLTSLSALNAGNYAATREMARLIGESQGFKFLFLEGENKNIYLCNVGYDFLLSIVFAKTVALGMIRIYANKAVKQISSILEKAQKQEQMAEEFLDVEFNTLLGKAFDASFRKPNSSTKTES